VRDEFGVYPAALDRAILRYPTLAMTTSDLRVAQSIDARTVVRWDKLPNHCDPGGDFHSRPGILRGRRVSGGVYDGFELFRPEYEQIGTCEEIEHWEGELQQLQGFSASKAPLHEFSSTDDMIMACRPHLIADLSESAVRGNLAHNENRILHDPGTVDHFAYFRWDGRLFLMNEGGSHHLAAAKYISGRIGMKVPLKGRLRIFGLNSAAVESLLRDFEMFVVADQADVACALHAAMHSVRATWLWHRMPPPFCEAKVMLLPRSERRSMRVASVLRRAGAADFGHYLRELANQRTDKGLNSPSQENMLSALG
jgi:hypothetical protein